jgi:hypothetical protein
VVYRLREWEVAPLGRKYPIPSKLRSLALRIVTKPDALLGPEAAPRNARQRALRDKMDEKALAMAEAHEQWSVEILWEYLIATA